MGKQINQYTKERFSGTVQGLDLMDLDSTEDAGGTFESAKMKVSEFLSYIQGAIQTFYSADGTLSGERTVDSNTFGTTFKGGDVNIKMNDAATDRWFNVQTQGKSLRARLGFSQSKDSGNFEMYNGGGIFLKIEDRVMTLNSTIFVANATNIGIGTNAPDASAICEMNSANKGFLPPRMVGEQVAAIASPAAGLMVYNTSLNQPQYYNGTVWVSI